MIAIILLILSFNPLFSNKIILSEHSHSHGKKHIHDNKFLNDKYRKDMQYFVDSEDGNFRVHYDLSGDNAVTLTDSDNNEIPDYIDSTLIFLVKSYDVEVNQLGWNEPVSDLNASSNQENGGSGAIDVYIVELLNERTYGYASPVTVDNENGNSGFLVLDNNYTDKIYHTKSFDALKVTVAHEFHHIIQFSYGKSLPSRIISEMLSTYIENKVFPETLDMKNYVDSLFRSPLSSQIGQGDFTYGYMYNIFFHYVDLKYGQEQVHELWEVLIGKNEHFLRVWDRYFKETFQTSMEIEFTEFVEWCYYSGDRAVEGQYFPFGKYFTNLRPSLNEKFSEPSVSDSKNLYSMGFNYLRIEYPTPSPAETNDTIDVLITNVSLAKLENIPLTDTYYFATFSSQEKDSDKLIDIDYYVSKINKNIFDFNIIEYPGIKPQTIEDPYPSPVRLNLTDYIVFPVDPSHKSFDEVELQILNSNMENILRAELNIEVVNNKKVVKLNDLSKIKKSGIYYYTIKNSDKSIYGKFAVVR